ncbi:hypothetical protein CRG98_041971 [Punica granatum]|nr:hypothetical protein CRG98_041971 [Punica granatum]
MEIDGPSYVPQEPRVLFGSTTNVHHPNVPFGNASSSVDLHHLPDHYDNPVPYGMNHYNTFHPPANFDLGASSVPRMPPVPVNYGSSSQISSYGNYLVHGGTYQDYGRNHFMDGVGCSYKRKTVESLPENNYPYSSASTSTSSSVMGPMETRHPSEVGLRDAVTSYTLPRYGEGERSIALEESSSRSVRNRSAVSGINSAHTHNYGNPLSQGTYSSGQSFQQGGPFWLDQPSSSNSIEGGALGWSPPPLVMPFMNASNVNGVPMEVGNQGVQGPLEANGSRSSTNFLHFPYFNPQHYNLPYPSHPVHGIRGGNGNLAFHPQAPVSFHRAPSRSVSHPGPFEPTRMQWPYSAGIVPERHHNGPHFRVSAVDEHAIIDYGEAYGVGNYDHHRDLRLDIEDMSYEELLALGELIGSVNTGLPEETITSQLKTRTWASMVSINLEELPCEDQEAASCIICQDAYEDRDKIGTLDCGHEYHADCLKKWLLVKNVCPICKSEALPGNWKDL